MYFPSSAFLYASLALVAPVLACGKKQKVTKLDVDFSTFASSGKSLVSFLNQHELYVSGYQVGSEPLAHTFVKDNVDVQNGALRLKVDGQSGEGDVKSAEIATFASNIRYGTFTTVAKLTPVPGICAGFFTYTDDNNE